MPSIQMYRNFGGVLYKIRSQPHDKLHSGFVDPYTVKYKRDAEVIRDNRKKRGESVRIVKVSRGYRVYVKVD